MPAAGRAARRDAGDEAGKRIGAHQLADAGGRALIGQRREVELDVGPLQLGPRAEEAAALIDAERERSAARQHVAQPRFGLAPPGAKPVVQARQRRAVAVLEAEMGLQMPTYARAFSAHPRP